MQSQAQDFNNMMQSSGLTNNKMMTMLRGDITSGNKLEQEILSMPERKYPNDQFSDEIKKKYDEFAKSKMKYENPIKAGVTPW